MSLIDLDSYLERIRHVGTIRCDLDTLSALLRAHMLRIPFENLDVLLGRPIRLDLDSIQAKLVHASRGGYCFEHASLFAAVLEDLGFCVSRHTARVVMHAPREAAARTHMFLTVAMGDRRFVCDPGFGLLAPRVPVPLIDGESVQIGMERHWMSRQGDYWMLKSGLTEPPVEAWQSTLVDDQPVDFAMGNHFTSTWPESAFVNRILLRVLTSDGSVSLMNRALTIRRGDQTVRSELADRKALRRLLIDCCGFDLPEIEQLRVPSIPEWD